MDLFAQFIEFILHLDQHLAVLSAQYGTLVYWLLFAIVFCETGLVVTPFLPGDSLLFVAGALAAVGVFDVRVLLLVLFSAALLGDNCNYWIGRWAGERIVRWGEGAPRIFNKKALDRAHLFFERWGPATMTIARFIPLVRTFAPFAAGMARMGYRRFFLFDFLGAVLWVFSLCSLGFWFGNFPIVKNNLWLVIVAIIAISLLPVAIAWLRGRLATRPV